jgi:hypothetical protein
MKKKIISKSKKIFSNIITILVFFLGSKKLFSFFFVLMFSFFLLALGFSLEARLPISFKSILPNKDSGSPVGSSDLGPCGSL